MAIDVKKLKSMQKDLKEKAGDGDGIMLFSNKIEEETEVRLLPPSEEMNGVYFVEQEGWWVNGKFYLSNSTAVLGGKRDIIDAEIDLAKAAKDPDLDSLISAKNNGMPLLKNEVRYLIPLVMLEIKYDEEDSVDSIKEIEAKVLVAKPTLITAINALVTAKPYQNGTVDGLMDQKKGWNVILSKTGKGKETKYSVTGWTQATEMADKWYEEKTWKEVDPIALTKSMSKSDAHLQSVIRNYLYGEAIIDDAKAEPKKANTDADAAPPQQKIKKATVATADEKIKKPKISLADSEPETDKKPARGRSLLDDAAAQLNDPD